MNQDEKRSFFRISGTLYLNAKRKCDSNGNVTLAPPEKMDELSIRIMHYLSKLRYEKPAGSEYIMELAEIVSAMNAARVHSDRKNGDVSDLARQSVIISGSGMEFFTDESWVADEVLTMTISFPEYPFATVMTDARVVSERTAQHRKKIAVEFQGIAEQDRDLIIKYVNHLQRKKIAKS
jgi:hypothetical protein